MPEEQRKSLLVESPVRAAGNVRVVTMSNGAYGTPEMTAAAGAATAIASTAAVAQTATTSASLGPNSTGVPGPGDFAGGKIDFAETAIRGPENFDTFGCDVFRENPNTPDFVTANVYFERRGAVDFDLRMPDGKTVRFWVFEDPLKARGRVGLPSPLIRVQEEDLVHVKLGASKSSHTIHHHGIAPTPFNDGVGHTSFEVTGNYIYQWQPRLAGTYFYHCHKNTVLHFEMGMYGLLIVDPKPEDGKIRAYKGGPEYDVERFWVLDDVDPRWHELNHDAGMCGDDVRLNIFEPKYFLITGTPTRPNVSTDAQKIVAKPEQKILIRLLNASYSLLKVTIEGLEAQVISTDGNALNQDWNAPFTIPANTPFTLATAQRRGLLIDTGSAANRAQAGRPHKVTFDFLHWITGKRHNAGDRTYEGYASTTIEF
jgi:Multicopper oxidase